MQYANTFPPDGARNRTNPKPHLSCPITSTPHRRRKGNRMDPNDPNLQAAVAEAVEHRAAAIRAKARADHATELEEAGHPAAARHLREVPGE